MTDFEHWRERVDNLLSAACGLTYDELTYWRLKKAWLHESDPTEVAFDTLEMNGLRQEILESLADKWGLR